MAESPPRPSGCVGAFPDSPVDKNWSWPLRFIDERIRHCAHLPQATCKTFSHEQRIAPGPGAPMTVDELKQVAKRYYPEYEVTRVYERKNPDQPVEILLERGERKIAAASSIHIPALTSRSASAWIRFILWLADLHDNRCTERPGFAGMPAARFLRILLCLTGAVIWWPGIRKLAQQLDSQAQAKSQRTQLGAATAHWDFGPWRSFLCGESGGLYLSIPESFNAVVDFLEPMRDFK